MEENFDFIVVGAGSAGCILANRLSQNPAHSVLLIEAGGKDRSPTLHIPGGYVTNFHTKNDWSFWTTPQPHVLNRKIYLPRGKTLGGCSSINAMAYVRGNAADYDHWSALGNPGWDADAVRPYFIKSEHHEQAHELDSAYHGTGGELNVTKEVNYPTPYSAAFIEAGQAIGLPLNPDYNGAEQRGVGRFHFNMKDARRNSSSDAFLAPILGRKNLRVLTKTALTRIHLDNKAVSSIEVRSKGQKRKIKVNKELILSAGAFHSPQLLMLSGIGDPSELQAHGIGIQHALPGVGKNLQDHLFYPISAIAKTHEGLNQAARPLGLVKNLIRYYISKKGPFSIGPLEAVAFFHLDDLEATPNFQMHFAPMHVGKEYGKDFYRLSSFNSSRDGFSLLPSLLHPKSRGTVRLTSNDPFAAPEINPNFLSEEEDLQALIKGGKFAAKMLEQAAMQAHLAEMALPNVLPSDDEGWIAHIKQTLETIYHPVGTCKMGPGPEAVVDHELKVHGLAKLRVADASIMPTIVTGNTNAPVYMIAEKAADMILKG